MTSGGDKAGTEIARQTTAAPAQTAKGQTREMISFWRWFARGRQEGYKPGYRRIVDGWLWLHIVVGTLASICVSVSLSDAAKTVLLPLAGVFVGVSFAWGANANALLQSPENEEMAKNRGGVEEYAYTFQLAMLVILTSLALWGTAGLEVFDATWPGKDSAAYQAVEFIFYTTVSLTLRESWHVALGAQMLLLTRVHIRENRDRAGK